MTKKTIEELNDGRSVLPPDARVPFQIPGGATFFGSVRPNPTVQINAINQAQLEAALTSNLVIPDGTTVSISIDESFTLTKPFLIGDGAVLEIFAPNVETVLTYDDTGNTLFQQNTGSPIRALIITNLQLTSQNGTEILLDGLVGTSRLFVTDTRFASFARMGTIEIPFVRFNGIAPFNIGIGFILKKVTTFVMVESLLRNPSANGTTFISFFTDGVPVTALANASLTSDISTGDRLFYLDPNSPAGSSYSIKDTSFAGTGDFYQLGVNANADAIAGAPAGSIRLTVTGHGLDVGQVVNVSGFVVNTGYNATSIVTAIIDVNTVEVEGTFVAPEAGGNLDANSLDGTSVLVSSDDNTDVPDSMSHAEERTDTVLEVDGSGGIDVPVVDVTPTPTDWVADGNTEEFTIDTTTGLITYNGIDDKTFLIQYQLTAAPTTGPSQQLTFDVHINGVIQLKASTSFNTSSESKATYIGGLFVLSNGDTVQLFKNNFTNTNNTTVQLVTLLVTAS